MKTPLLSKRRLIFCLTLFLAIFSISIVNASYSTVTGEKMLLLDFSNNNPNWEHNNNTPVTKISQSNVLKLSSTGEGHWRMGINASNRNYYTYLVVRMKGEAGGEQASIRFTNGYTNNNSNATPMVNVLESNSPTILTTDYQDFYLLNHNVTSPDWNWDFGVYIDIAGVTLYIDEIFYTNTSPIPTVTAGINSSAGNNFCEGTTTTLSVFGLTNTNYVWSQTINGITTPLTEQGSTIKVFPRIGTTTYSVSDGIETLTKTIEVISCCGNIASNFSIAKICTPLTINGSGDEGEWNMAPWVTIDKNHFLDGEHDCNRYNIGTPISNPGGIWRAMYDNNYIYFFVRVYDSSPNNNSTGNDANAHYWQDAVEIYINNQGQYGYTYNSSGIPFTYGNGANKGNAVIIKNTDSWDLEVRIPLSSNNIDLSSGTLRMEVAVNQSNGSNDCRSAQLFTWEAKNYYNTNADDLYLVSLSDCLSARASNNVVCNGGTTVLSTSLEWAGENNSYSWEESTDGINWISTSFSNGDEKYNYVTVTPTHNPTYYRALYNSVPSCPVQITMQTVNVLASSVKTTYLPNEQIEIVGSTTLTGDDVQWGWKKSSDSNIANAVWIPSYGLSNDVSKKTFVKTVQENDEGYYFFVVQKECEASSEPLQITVPIEDDSLYECINASDFYIQKTCSTPTIDGLDSEIEWRTTPWVKIDKNHYLDGEHDCNRYNIGTPTSSPGGIWRVMYDDNFVYFFVRVYDSSPNNNSTGNDANAHYWQDAVEIYINDSMQYGYTYNSNGIPFTYGSGVNKGNAAIIKNTDSWDLEVRIPVGVGNNINLSSGSLQMEVGLNQSNGTNNCRSAQLFTWEAKNYYNINGDDLHLVSLSDCLLTQTSIQSSANSIECNGIVVLTANVNSKDSTHYYTWQESTNGGQTWSSANIFSGESTSNEISVKPTINNIQYRAIIGDIATCPVQITVTGDCNDSISNIIQVNNPTICFGSSATLIANVTGNGTYSYWWEKTGETSSSITVSPDMTTSYKVIVKDETGKPIGSAVAIVTVMKGEITEQNKNQVVLTAAGGQTYTWSTGENTSSIIITPIPSISKNYMVTISNDLLTCPISITLNPDTIIPPKPLVVLLDDTIFLCAGDFVSLEPTVYMGSGSYSYFWSTGDTTPSINVNDSKTYWVKITDNSTNVSADASVVVNTMKASITQTNTDNSVVLTAFGGDFYEWTGGAHTSHITVPQTTIDEIYTVNIINKYGTSCSASVTVPSDSIIPTVQPQLDFTVQGNQRICKGTSIVLSAVINNGSGSYSFFWKDGQTSSSVSIAPNSTTIYWVTVKDNITGISVTNSIKIEVITAKITEQGLNGATLTASGGMSYLWSTGEQTSSIFVSPDTTITYVVTVTDGSLSCMDSVVVEPIWSSDTTDTSFPSACTNCIVSLIGSSDYYVTSSDERVCIEFGNVYTGNIISQGNGGLWICVQGTWNPSLPVVFDGSTSNCIGCLERLDVTGTLNTSELSLYNTDITNGGTINVTGTSKDMTFGNGSNLENKGTININDGDIVGPIGGGTSIVNYGIINIFGTDNGFLLKNFNGLEFKNTAGAEVNIENGDFEFYSNGGQSVFTNAGIIKILGNGIFHSNGETSTNMFFYNYGLIDTYDFRIDNGSNLKLYNYCLIDVSNNFLLSSNANSGAGIFGSTNIDSIGRINVEGLSVWESGLFTDYNQYQDFCDKGIETPTDGWDNKGLHNYRGVVSHCVKKSSCYYDKLDIEIIATKDTIDKSKNESYTILTAQISDGKEGCVYLWSTGETTKSITVYPDITTTYWVKVGCPNLPEDISEASGDEKVIVVVSKCESVCYKSLHGIEIINPTCENNGKLSLIQNTIVCDDLNSTGISCSVIWKNSNNDIIGNTKVLTGISAGIYSATISCSNGCSFIKENIVVEEVSIVESVSGLLLINNGNLSRQSGYLIPPCSGNYVFYFNTGSLFVKDLLEENADRLEVHLEEGKTYPIVYDVFTSELSNARLEWITPCDTLKREVSSCSVIPKSIDPDNPCEESIDLELPTLVDICEIGGSVTLKAEALGVTYLWSTGETSSSIVVNRSGIYSLEVTNHCGVSLKKEVSVRSLKDIGLLSDDGTLNETISSCLGEPVQLNVQGAVSWSPCNYLSDCTISNPISNSPEEITYNTLISTAGGCLVNKQINISKKGIFNLETENTNIKACLGDILNLQVSGADEYLWEPSEGVSSPTSSSTNYVVTQDNTLLRIKGKKDNCVAEIEIKITTDFPDVFDFTFSQESCSITFDADIDGFDQYLWDLGDGNIAYGKSITHTYSTHGSYEVCLTVLDDSCNQSGRRCKALKIKQEDCLCQPSCD